MLINFKIALLLLSIFLFIIPLILYFTKNKILIVLYLIIYAILLIIGVFFDVTITYQNVKINILITDKWFSNNFIIANFSLLGILINIFLLFPIGSILPSALTKSTFPKIVIIGLLVSSSIEFLQFLLPIKRYPELLDILNNLISVILGYLYYIFINKLIRRGDNDRISKQENCT